jgi:hypothetical protein
MVNSPASASANVPQRTTLRPPTHQTQHLGRERPAQIVCRAEPVEDRKAGGVKADLKLERWLHCASSRLDLETPDEPPGSSNDHKMS